MLGLFVFIAAIVWIIWVMIMSVVAVLLMIFDMILRGLLALSSKERDL